MRGTEIPNHRAKMATRVPKGMAAEEPSTQRIKFMRKKSANTMLGKKDGQKIMTQTMISMCVVQNQCARLTPTLKARNVV